MLKKLRVGAAILIFALITLFFLDFAGIFPDDLKILTRIQFLPALLSGSFIILIILLAVTLLVGRIYCSAICPLGIFQDISSWFSKRFAKKKKRYRYSKPKTILRWVMVGILILALLTGFAVLQSILDPYAVFGRMASNLFYPIYILGNNLLEIIFTRSGNYLFYRMDPSILSISSFIVAALSFLIIGYLSWRWGRLYCNTICPVGTILGACSKNSLVKVRIDPEKCVSCGACSARCKATCIDIKAKSVDHSRCVDCYNCLGTCKYDALHYTRHKKEFKVNGDALTTASKPANSAQESSDTGRREFIATSLAALVLAPKVLAQQQIHILEGGVSYKRDNPICPPGAESPEHLGRHCTACHLCISKCPSRVLKPAFMEYGLSGMMQPVMFFEKGFCNFDCTVCGDVCPNKAIHSLSLEEKHLKQVGRVVFLKENCIVHTDHTNCGACSEHCPTQAVTMVPYEDGLTIPKTDPDICVGCGGCEFICPVRPFRAIYVNGNNEQINREAFHDEVQDIVIDDFGF